MGGDIWTIWDLHADASRAPRMVTMGRWAERGLHTLVRRTLSSDAPREEAPKRRLVLSVLGMIVALPEGASNALETDVTRLETWSKGDEAFSERAAHLERSWSGAGSGRTLEIVAATARLFEVDHAVRVTREALEREASRDPCAFAWARTVASHVPPEARLVTIEDRADGAPAPGSLWWPHMDGWVIVSTRALIELEQQRSPPVPQVYTGDSDHFQNPTRGVLAWPAEGTRLAGAPAMVLAPPKVGLYGRADVRTLQSIGLAL